MKKLAIWFKAGHIAHSLPGRPPMADITMFFIFPHVKPVHHVGSSQELPEKVSKEHVKFIAVFIYSPPTPHVLFISTPNYARISTI